MELSNLDANQQMEALGVLSTNQITIATFVHLLGDVCALFVVILKNTNIHNVNKNNP